MTDIELYEVVNKYLRDTYPDDDKVTYSVDVLFEAALVYGEDALDDYIDWFNLTLVDVRWFDVIKRAADVAETLESDRLAQVAFHASIKFSALYR